MTDTTNPTTIDAPDGVPWIDIRREFDAPVERVWRAMTDPALVTRWLGPRDIEMEVERYDVRPGGGYRYVHRRGDEEYAFRGVFHDARENESIIQTFEFEGAPGEVALEFMRFERLDGGRTRIVSRSVGRTVEGRDAMVASGMEHGIREGYERLDEVLGGLD